MAGPRERPPVSWVVDTMLTDRSRGRTGFPTLAEACGELGYPVYQTQYVPGSRAPDPGIPFGPGCVVAYGTMPFVRQVAASRRGAWMPGSFARAERCAYSAFAAHLGPLLLNEDFVVLPFAEAERRGFDLFGDAFFLRPDAVTKAFTGFVVTRENVEAEFGTFRQKRLVDPETLCVLARPRPIEAEFRFVIADREVVSGSQYHWADRHDVRLDVLPVCEEMAWEVARTRWQPDRVYVCDVALVEERTRARVVELNTFSSAGLYAIDTRRVVEAVSRSAWREFLVEDEP